MITGKPCRTKVFDSFQSMCLLVLSNVSGSREAFYEEVQAVLNPLPENGNRLFDCLEEKKVVILAACEQERGMMGFHWRVRGALQAFQAQSRFPFFMGESPFFKSPADAEQAIASAEDMLMRSMFMHRQMGQENDGRDESRDEVGRAIVRLVDRLLCAEDFSDVKTGLDDFIQIVRREDAPINRTYARVLKLVNAVLYKYLARMPDHEQLEREINDEMIPAMIGRKDIDGVLQLLLDLFERIIAGIISSLISRGADPPRTGLYR